MSKSNNTFTVIAELSLSGTTKLVVSQVTDESGKRIGTVLGKKLVTKTGEVIVPGCPMIPVGQEAATAKFIAKHVKA